MNHRIPLFLLGLALLAAGLSNGVAAIEGPPSTIDYQGTVYDSSGKPYGSEGSAPSYTAAPQNYGMQFRIYDKDGGLVWEERQIVTVTLGKFSVRLGNGSAIGPKHGDLSTVFDGSERTIGLTIEAGATPYGEITPRLAFLSVPYAFNSKYAVTAGTASKAVVADGVTQLSGTSTFDDLKVKTATVQTSMNVPTLTATGEVQAQVFKGSGASLTNIDASKIVGDKNLPDGVLSANIPRKNGTNIFSGSNTFSGEGNAFKGDGKDLTNLNPNNLSVPVPANKISDDVVKFALNDKPLYVRSSNDFHGLVFGNGNQNVKFDVPNFGAATKTAHEWFGVDGPVLFGYSGGGLGIVNNRGPGNSVAAKSVLTWGTDDVTVKSELKFSRPGAAATWYFNQTVDWPSAGLGQEMRLGCSATSSLWFYFQANGQFAWSSDIRLKKDVTDLPPVLDSVLKLRPVKYRFKERPETESKVVGFIAQDVLPLFPETVGRNREGYYSLTYSDFSVYAIGAIQELTAETRRKSGAADAEIRRLQDENRSLRQNLSDLERRLSALEAAK